MRNVWVFVSSLAVVVAIGGGVYYFFTKQWVHPEIPHSSAPQMPPVDSQVLVVPAGNPLLTADARQFDMWIPMYPIRCGDIVFQNADPKVRNFSFCVSEIKKRVATATNHQLSRDDVLDPRVKSHWREVMRGQ